MKRLHQTVLIGSTLLASWLGMQAVHESGHVLGAWLTGAEVHRVVLHPLTISRTDLGHNPKPLFVVWAGPVFGVLLPLVVWGAVALARARGAFLVRFFAGFCLIANGAYIGLGSLEAVGDCGEMLRHGSSVWQLWMFGAITIPAGFWLWHRQGGDFGFGAAGGQVDRGVTYGAIAACLALLALAFSLGGE